MLSWQTQNEDWRHALIHESGHAVMGAMKGIPCYGAFLIKSSRNAAVLVEPLPQPLALSDAQRLFLAAGSAAERIAFGWADLKGSRSDRELFGNPQGTTFDEKVIEAEALLLDKKPAIEKLALRLDAIVSRADGDYSGFRSQMAGMGDDITDHWELLSESELKEELNL